MTHDERVPARHIDVLSKHFRDAIASGDSRLILLNLPRAHATTTLLSVEMLKVASGLRVLYSTYTTLLGDNAKRNVGDADNFRVCHIEKLRREVFGRPDIVCIDNPLSERDAQSRVRAEGAVINVLHEINRMNTKLVVMAMPRACNGDFSDLLRSSRPAVEHICLPAVFERDHPNRSKLDWRVEGEPLWPEYWGFDRLSEMARMMGPRTFAWTMQQRDFVKERDAVDDAFEPTEPLSPRVPLSPT